MVTQLPKDGHLASMGWSLVNDHLKYGQPPSKGLSPRLQRMITHDLKHGQPPSKINQIWWNIKKLQLNMEFDTSAAQLVMFLIAFHKVFIIR